MPYLHCPSCRLTAYSAARWSSRDVCARCGEELAREPRPLFDTLRETSPKGDVTSILPPLPQDLPSPKPPPAAA